MRNLQNMFNQYEAGFRIWLERFEKEGYNIGCGYRELLELMSGLDSKVFDMLYNEDTENAADYELDDVDLGLEFDKLVRLLGE